MGVISGFRYPGGSPVSSRLSSLSPVPPDIHTPTDQGESTTRSGKRIRDLRGGLEGDLRKRNGWEKTVKPVPRDWGVKRKAKVNAAQLEERVRRLPKRYRDDDSAGTGLSSKQSRKMKSTRNSAGYKAGGIGTKRSAARDVKPKSEVLFEGEHLRSLTMMEPERDHNDKPSKRRKRLHGRPTPARAFDNGLAAMELKPMDTGPDQGGTPVSHKAGKALISALNLDHISPVTSQEQSSPLVRQGLLPAPPTRTRAKGPGKPFGDPALHSQTVPAANPTGAPTAAQPILDRTGYPSSRFCKVLRLVAGLAPPTSRLRTEPRTCPPTRRPLVWAEASELCPPRVPS